MRSDAYDLNVSSVVVSAPPRFILPLLALGQCSVEIDEKSDEDVSAMVPRPGVGGANQRVQRYPSRLVRAGKLELECSVQLPVSRLPELSGEGMRCQPWHCDPSARQTALNLDNVALCQAVEHRGEVNRRSRSRPLLGDFAHRHPSVRLNATAQEGFAHPRPSFRSSRQDVHTGQLAVYG